MADWSELLKEPRDAAGVFRHAEIEELLLAGVGLGKLVLTHAAEQHVAEVLDGNIGASRRAGRARGVWVPAGQERQKRQQRHQKVW